MTVHFKLHEFSCPTVRTSGRVDRRNREPVPDLFIPNIELLCEQLEKVRSVVARPIEIISGWRSKAYNKLNPGRSQRSLHLKGMAGDAKCKGITSARLYWIFSDLIADGTILPGGLARYPSFVHYDIRGRYANGRMARWKPTPKRPRRGPGSKQP